MAVAAVKRLMYELLRDRKSKSVVNDRCKRF